MIHKHDCLKVSIIVLAGIFFGFAALPSLASTAGPGGGSGLQWETGLQMIVRSITGPVAYAFGALGVVALGVRLAGGADMTEFTKHVLHAVMGLSFVMFAVPILGTLMSGAVIQ